MWDTLLSFPRGRISTRSFVLFFATFIVASLTYVLAVPTSVHAVDASWEGSDIVYEDQVYRELNTSNARGLGDIPDGASVYQYAPAGNGRKNVKLIYFASGQTPASSKEATYIVYTLNPPNRYSDPRNEQTITMDSATATQGSTSQGETSCAIDNVGWLVCGISGFIAEGTDSFYALVSSFLTVQPITDGNNSLYRMWEIMRNFANVMFTIGFMVVIYSYLVGGGFSGYEIRKIIPRVIIAAILINASYWIVAIAVDASNIVGASLQDVLISIRETAVGTEENKNVGWGELTGYILSGGTIGALGFLAATGGSIVSFGFLLLGVLITVVFSLFVAFIILVARQAIIIVLIILAPLAFAAYILPNTEKWFDRWRGLLTTMLVLFPLFSLLFGGAQLAGAAIIQNATNLAVMIFGMAVQIVPLILTPLLIQYSGGLVGRIAGIVNNAERGLMDRSKGWTRDQAAYHKDKALAHDNRRYNVARRGGQAMYRRSKNREDRQKNYQQEAENRRHAHGSYEDVDTQRREAEARHKFIDAGHNEHWQRRFDIQDSHFDQRLYQQEVATRAAGDRTKLAEERLDTTYTEMKAGRNPYHALGIQGRTTADMQAQIDEIEVTAQSLALEGLKRQSAEVTIQNANAMRMKANEALRTYAGGIGGEDAAARVFARAKSEVVEEYLKTVKAMGSVQEDYSVKELINVAHHGKRRDGSPATEAEIDSAIQQIVTVKGNNWSFQKLKDHIATLGLNYDEEAHRYYDKDANGNKVYVSDEEADSRRTRQQIFADAAKNSKLKIAHLSGTDRGNLENGTFTMRSEDAIIRDIRDQKINANRLASTDVDELMRMVQVLRDDDKRGTLSSNSRQSLIDKIEFALDDPMTKANIGAREQKLMNVIGDYLKLGPTATTEQKVRIESQTETPIPTYYDPDRFYDPPAKFVPPEPGRAREPYGPNASTRFVTDTPQASDETDTDTGNM